MYLRAIYKALEGSGRGSSTWNIYGSSNNKLNVFVCSRANDRGDTYNTVTYRKTKQSKNC